jgi:hypothetical protein
VLRSDAHEFPLELPEHRLGAPPRDRGLKRENLGALDTHHKCVLELRAPCAIGSYRSPTITPGPVAPGAGIDHGLDRERHAGLHDGNRVRSEVVGDGESVVKDLADAVADVGADDAEAGCICMGFDCLTDV